MISEVLRVYCPTALFESQYGFKLMRVNNKVISYLEIYIAHQYSPGHLSQTHGLDTLI